MPRWILGLLIACAPEPPAQLPDDSVVQAPEVPSGVDSPVQFDQQLPAEALPLFGDPGRSVLSLLDHLGEATLELPATNLDPDWTRREILGGPWIHDRTRKTWKARLSKEFKNDIASGTPRNLELLRNGEAVPFLASSSLPRDGKICWQVKDSWVHIHGLGNPKTWDSPPMLERSARIAAMDRLNLSASGLPAEQFAAAHITLGQITRKALLLPSPGRADFSLELPAEATLRMGAGIARVPGLPDTASAGIELHVNGEPVWSRELDQDEDWQTVEIDLKRWAGKSVQLSLRSTELGEAHGDWVALAEPEILGPPTGQGPRRILVLGIDTLRPDHLGTHGYAQDTSPFLDQMASQSLVFESAWAPAPRTRPSFRTVNTGRWPTQARNAPSLGAMLGDEGFRTAGIVANVHLSPQMGFSDGYGLWRYAHSGDAADQVDHALSWLQSHSEEDSFLFLHFMDPHIFYMAPEPWTDRFTEGEPPEELADRYNRRTIERLEARGLLDERTQNFIEGRYSGEIGYLDSELGRLVEAVDALPGETTIVVLSDHGEEFWEHGGFEHNHSLYQELTRALLWIRPPRGQLTDGPYRVTADVSLADLAPTLLDLLGSNSPRPPLDGLSLLPLLQGDHPTRARLASELSSRRLPMGHLMYGTERWGVVQERHKYILHRANGEQELFDLRADPGEQNNLAGTANLSTWWTALEDATGYPTGSGWRVEISQLRAPLRLHMAQPIRAAEVIDPESKRSRRSNQEWGESPVLQSADVATLSLSEDGRVLEIEPGVHGRGTLALLGDPGQVQVMDEEGQMQGEPLEADQSLRLPGGPSLVSSTGVVILAGETESLHPAVSAEADQREALQSLGYLE